MKFIVEFRLRPGCKDKLFEAFELRGPNRHPGVSFRGAWIGSRSDVAFALIESADESLLEKAGESWRDYAEFVTHPVIDVEDY